MYTVLVVGFNCDIYETWESNICAPDSFCGSATQRTLFPKGLNCALIIDGAGESICQVLFS